MDKDGLKHINEGTIPDLHGSNQKGIFKNSHGKKLGPSETT